MKLLKKIMVVVIGVLLAVIYSIRTWPIAIYDTNIDATAYENVGGLKQGAKVEQSFYCMHNGLKSIKITVSNLGYLCDIEYYWTLVEVETGKVVGEGYFNGAEIDNSKKSEFTFEKQKNSKNKHYVFAIEADKDEAEYGITVMTTKANRNQEENIILNGIQQESVMVLSQEIQYMNIETGVVFVGLYFYLVYFMRFLLKLFK